MALTAHRFKNNRGWYLLCQSPDCIAFRGPYATLDEAHRDAPHHQHRKRRRERPVDTSECGTHRLTRKRGLPGSVVRKREAQEALAA